MGSVPEGRMRAFAATAIAIALSAAAWWFGTGLEPMWWATWWAPLPVLWLATRARLRTASFAAFIAATLGACNQWAHLHEALDLPLPVVVMAIVWPGVVAALLVAVFGAWMRRGHAVRAVLASTALATALAFIAAGVSPHGTWGHVAYTQMDATWVIQIASVTGLWGIGALLWWVPACAAASMAPAARNVQLRLLAVGVGVLACVLAFGAWRLQAPARASIRVALLDVDAPIRSDVTTPQGARLAQRYADEATRLIDAGARVVVLPETAFASPQPRIDALAALATSRSVLIVAGIDHLAAGNERNIAVAHGPNARPAYVKQHLIPGFEARYRAGTERPLALPGTPRMAVAICKDLDFSHVGRDAAGAQLLLVPAWDFHIDGWMHARMAMLRGVENGLAVARSARDGRLTLSDDRGRVLVDETATGTVATAMANVPLRDTRTFYSEFGDWFAWVCVLVALLGLAALVRRPLARTDRDTAPLR